MDLLMGFEGTVSLDQNRLKVVWLDRPWLEHPSLFFLFTYILIFDSASKFLTE